MSSIHVRLQWVRSPPPTTITPNKPPKPSIWTATDSTSREAATASSSWRSFDFGARFHSLTRFLQLSLFIYRAWTAKLVGYSANWDGYVMVAPVGVRGKRCMEIAMDKAGRGFGQAGCDQDTVRQEGIPAQCVLGQGPFRMGTTGVYQTILMMNKWSEGMNTLT